MFIVMAVAALSGCGVGKYDYTPPMSYPSITSSVTVSKPKDFVWKRLIAELSKRFFIVNNLDKESGFINVSYSGDPEKYINCGTITSYIKHLHDERTFTFPGSSAHQQYQMIIDMLYNVNREMTLEGRMNITVAVIDEKSTTVSSNAKYIVTRKTQMYNPQGMMVSNTSDTINFNTGGTGVFPMVIGRPISLTCTSNGSFEKEVLDIVM